MIYAGLGAIAGLIPLTVALARQMSTQLRIGLLTALMAASTQAHLLPEQRGTLRLVEEGTYLVLSLPASAFQELDEDGDGKVTMDEFNRQRTAVIESVKTKVVLSDAGGNLALEGILLAPEAAHTGSSPDITHITVMGRFAPGLSATGLRFEVGLYGTGPGQRALNITATSPGDHRKEEFKLTPEQPGRQLFQAIRQLQVPSI